MAYDPNDPKDVELVEGMVAEATNRLKAKNEELIGELRTARQGKVDPEKVEKLERQLSEVQDQLEVANKAAKRFETDAKKANDLAEKATGRANSLLTGSAIDKALIDNKIAPHFHDAVKAMFGSKATITVTDGVENVMIGDKSASDALKEFAASGVGKHYVAAANNGGGGSNGGGGDRGANSMSRSAFDALDPQARMDFSKAGGTLTET